ncbi:hypothetical protein PHB09_031 [Pseudomonas phage PHB09]|uniref:SGNH hydrolase-type esterase domain-containing protein n=1 Tax=Pseudomonas phage PHB09 TaxID=2867265 RepID=A0AAE8XC76_9CAUD|nr:hypothetical protein QGX10_gp031 [Pseudomonas phage PHB09]UAV84527.1 hypothetical protein PHB09_031 [Pseudomonas phage PHB09]
MTRNELETAVAILDVQGAIHAGYFDALLNPSGGGAVKSVNGKTGDVTLAPADVSAYPAASGNSLKTSVDSLTTSVGTNTSDVASLKTSKLNKDVFNPQAMMGFFGDSRTAQNESTSNVNVPAPLARSQAWWAQTLSKGRLMRSHFFNFGQSGDSVKDLKNRVVGDVANAYGIKPSDPGYTIAVVMIGTNSVNSLVDFNDMVADMLLIISTLKGLGKIVNIVAEWPRGIGTTPGTTGYLSADSQKLMYRWSNYLKSLRSDRELTIIDVWPEMCNPAATDCTPLVPEMLNDDGLHNSTGSGFVTGGKIATENVKRVGPANWCPSQNGDLFSAQNPFGCLNSNPMMVGTTGTLGSGASGTSPTGYTLSSSGGVTVVGSTTTYNGRPCVKLVVSGTTTSSNAYVRLRATGYQSQVSAGDVLIAGYEYAVENGYTNFAAPTVMIDPNVAAERVYGGLGLGGDNPIPASVMRAHEGVSLSARYTVPPTIPASLGVEFRPMFTDSGVASALTIYIFSAFIRKV